MASCKFSVWAACAALVVLSPLIASGFDTLDSVLVVPNPYNVSGRTFGSPSSGSIQGFERILFTNLPNPVPEGPTAIKIYTLGLNHITTLEHRYNPNLNVNPSYAWNGRNSDNQYIASGVYIYVIDHPKFGQTIGKFVVIR